MKNISFVIILLMNFTSGISQSIFKVVEVKRNFIAGNDTLSNLNSMYYRIVLTADSVNRILAYPIVSEKSDIDTVEAIRELLSLKGDTRMCVLPIMGYNTLSSQLYMGTKKNYSIQMEALFIINQLITDRPFIYSPYPVLVDKINNSEASVSGPIIDKAFNAYCNWYLLLKKMGIQEIRARRIMPLDGTQLRWY